MTDAALPPASALLKERDYLLFWASRWCGALGSQLQSVAMGWMVYDLSRAEHLSVERSVFNVGMIGLASFLPLFALSLPAGETADRYDRRRLLMACYVGEVVAAAILVAATVGGFASVNLLLGVAVLFGAARAFFMPATTALAPMLV